MKRNYTEEAIKLAKAIDIAINAYTLFLPQEFTKETLAHITNEFNKIKILALNPEPEFRKIASLEYLIEVIFTFFQESNGVAVEYFWQEIEKNNLGYIREDKLRKIINQKKIKSHIEYDLVIDSLVIAEQEGRITEQEVKQLNKMIAVFVKRPE